MLKLKKIQTLLYQPKNEIWFGSDIHFGHANIIKYCDRPFADVEEMNEGIIERWNARVSPHDTVIVPGDVAMGRGIKESIKLTKRLNGHKVLIPGNHDLCFQTYIQNADAEKITLTGKAATYIEAGFQEILPPHISAAGNLFDQDVVLSHMPYSRDERHGDRHSEAHPIDEGLWCIHGHVHGLWQVNGREINVSIDAWDLAPIHIDEIKSIMNA